jgi:hypothetical protein
MAETAGSRGQELPGTRGRFGNAHADVAGSINFSPRYFKALQVAVALALVLPHGGKSKRGANGSWPILR